jgi:CHAD domain-containing protein
VQQLEQEVKLDPSPGWVLPDLFGILPGVQAEAIPDVALETTYYDTSDLRLARHNLTLRFRRQTELVPGARRTDDRTTTEVWTVKLPASSADNTVLARTEVTWPAQGSPGVPAGRRAARRTRATGRGLQSRDYEFEKVHAEAVQFVQAVALGRPLEPVAHLSSLRRRTELRTSDGRPLAEIDEDTITGRDLLATQERLPRHGDTPDVRFREVEVELAEGSAVEVLDAVVRRLEAAGARRSPGKSKLARVLAGGSSEVSLQDLYRPAPAGGHGQEVAMSEVLRDQARSCLDALVDHDPAIRLDDPDPEHIHKSRVATRRFRTILREFAPLVTYSSGADLSQIGHGVGTGSPTESTEAGGPESFAASSQSRLDDTGVTAERTGDRAGDRAGDTTGGRTGAGARGAGAAGEEINAAELWFAAISEDLKWLGGILGSVRDSDVRMQSLEDHCAQLPATDAPAVALLLATARGQRQSRHEAMREAMSTGRYLDLLRSLDALASGPGPRSPVPNALWVLLSEPAATGMPALAHQQWRALRKAVRRLGPAPSDDALHRVRIQAKRVRYLAEVAAPVVRPAAHRDAASLTAKAATVLQDVLGDLHDGVVTEEWLRKTALVAATSADPAALVAMGLAAGQLIAVEQQTQRASRAKWPVIWHRLDRKSLRTWASDTQ